MCDSGVERHVDNRPSLSTSYQILPALILPLPPDDPSPFMYPNENFRPLTLKLTSLNTLNALSFGLSFKYGLAAPSSLDTLCLDPPPGVAGGTICACG